MADVKLYLPLVRQLEGTLSDDQYDLAAAHPCPYYHFGKQYHTSVGVKWTEWAELIGVTPESAERWFKMSDEDLALIVGKIYWNPIRCNDITSISVAIAFADWDYNSGQGTATKHIQRVLGIMDDGICGNDTIKAINSNEPNALYHAIMEARETFFKSLNNPKEIEGWLNRLPKIDTYVKTLTLHV